MTAQTKPLKFVALIAVSVAFVTAGILAHQLFRTSHINCTLITGEPCPENLSTLLSNLDGTSLFFTKFESVLAGEPYSKEPYTLSSLSKNLPSTLNLTFKQEPLLYGLRFSDGATELIGKEGTVIRLDNLPEIAMVEIEAQRQDFFESEDRIIPYYHNVFAGLINSLYKYELIFQNITWKNNYEIRVDLVGHPTAITSENDPIGDMEKLKLLIPSPPYNSVEEEIVEIDLRFDMPVLRTRE